VRLPKPRKRLGQHYLRDPRYVEAIVSTICADPVGYFVEIGGGPGIITERLVACGKRVEVWEVDRRFEGLLRGIEGVEKVVIADFLTAPLNFPEKIGFCGNLPYNISTPVIEKVLRCGCAKVAYFTVQEEFAKRVVGGEKRKERSRLTLFVHNFAVAKVLFRIPPEAFHPPPRVNSSFLKLVFREKPLYPWEEVQPLVEAGFSERRKKLSSLIARRFGLLKEEVETFLTENFGNPNVRAEELTLDDFWRIHLFVKGRTGGGGHDGA